MAFAIIAIQINGTIQAFISLASKPENTASIGLIAVAKNYQNYGLGTQLINKAIKLCKKQGYTQLTVVTQGANTAACKFYEKNSFKKIHESNIFHLWL